MDALNDPYTETIAIMSSAQVGKTEFLLNIIGYFVAQDPAPILVVQPTLQMAETFSKDRLAPMIRDTPALKGKIKDPRARDSGNTLLKKNFPGGHITLAGSNSPASLASRPVRIVLFDEVDRAPASAGSEGDPVNLARKRATTFYNRKIVLTSTPTLKGASRIETAYEESDQRRYFVPCPDCGHKQFLKWSGIQWQDPAEVSYVCEECGTLIPETKKAWMLKRGEWIATAPKSRTVGFHLNELVSPWRTWSEVVADFIEAKKNTETLKTFVNTSLGETWEEAGEQVEAGYLYDRREEYGTELPADVLVLTAGVDIQDNRIELEVIGWGEGETSYGIEYRVIYGDLSQQEIWTDLDRALLKSYTHENGAKLKVAAACIDSGGHYTQMVYSFCRNKKARRVYPIKGMGGAGRAIVTAPRKTKTGNQRAPVDLFTIGVDEAKNIIYSRLKLTEGPGLCHWPISYDAEYFEQLTAEKVVTKFKKGFPFKEWIKTRPRNEALDIRVYGYAALIILNPVFELIKQNLQHKPDAGEKATEPSERRNNRRRRGGGYVQGWR